MDMDAECRRIVFCDSGVGGADMAAHFVDALREGACAPKIEVVLFNAWMRPGFGFNQLPTRDEKVRALKAVLAGITRISPDETVFACNTLSAIWNGAPFLQESISFRVSEMVMPTTEFLLRALRDDPESPLLLCGTATTAGSRIYEKRLIARGVSPERIFSLGCPGLATQIEYAPSGAMVQMMIRRYAREAAGLFSAPPEKLLTALCCTHFGYSPLWKKEFSARFGEVGVFNPNRAAVEALLPRWRGNFRPEFSVRFLTRVDFPAIKAQALTPCFAGRAPEIIGALFHPERDIGLFDF